MLLVDDDSAAREITAEGLEDAGFRVVAVVDAPAALEMLDGGLAAEIVVADYSIPDMDGLTLIRKMQRFRPRLPAILLMGFATNAAELAVGGAVSGSFSLLRKPIGAAALCERIQVLLAGAESRHT